jgi:hypothetical protein
MAEQRIAVRAPVVAHLALMAAFATVADVTTPGTLWVGALVYVLLQGGRALREWAHVWIARRTGVPVGGLRLGVLTMAVDMRDRTLWAAEANARKNTALAGSLAQAAFGALLIAAARLCESSQISEPVLLVGLLHVAGLSHLLPVSGAAGENILGFGKTWRVRPGWLASLPLLLIQMLLAVATTVAAFPNGTVHAYVISATDDANSRVYISSVARGVR